MIAVFCETPYQLLNALNLVYQKYKDECILYIRKDMFKSDIKFDLGENGSGFVKEIRYIKRNNLNKSFIKKVLFKAYLMIVGEEKGTLKWKIPGIDLKQEYTHIICIKYSRQAKILYDYLKNKPEVVQVEEGIGEYLVLDDIYSNNYVIQISSKKYVCEPKLYPKQLKIPICKAPTISSDKQYTDILNELFHYRKSLPLYKRFIYFGQAFAKDYNNPRFDAIENQCFDVLKEMLPEQIVIKNHPRNNLMERTTIPSFHEVTPWECCINELPEGIDNSVLISISSTSIISPKLMCDKEPYIIILAKIFESELKNILAESNYYERLIEFFNSLKASYRNPQKVFMPASIEELKETLKLIKSCINQ